MRPLEANRAVHCRWSTSWSPVIRKSYPSWRLDLDQGSLNPRLLGQRSGTLSSFCFHWGATHASMSFPDKECGF